MKAIKFICGVLLFSLIIINLTVTGVCLDSNIIGADAQICRDIGIIAGENGGVSNDYLSRYATRLQAMHITTRLLGKEQIASSFVWKENFNDVSKVGYESGRNLLGYVKVHSDLGWKGDYAGNINPTGFLTAQAMYKVLLSVLGYVPDVDFSWDETIAFAKSKGMAALASKEGFLTNNDISIMLVEALKTRLKDKEETLCEYLVEIGVIERSAAYDASMIPGSPGFKPLLTYRDGGPLLISVELNEEQKKVSIELNTELNPTYAKTLRNYNYMMPGTGYMPLPNKCMTSVLNERTVVIQFPAEGWFAYINKKEADAFFIYIATERLNELKASGLYDVDDNLLRDIYLDVPAAKSAFVKFVSQNNVYTDAAMRGPVDYNIYDY